MKPMRLIAVLSFALCLSANAANAQVPIIIGSSWDGAANSLQNILDAEYGPGAIDVLNDYIGANASDPDPFYWTDGGFSALIIREVAGNENSNVVGWYKETGVAPVIDGIDDGVFFTGPANSSNPPVIVALSSVQNFGFYMNPNGPGSATNAPEPELFFTNRFYNDIGPNGSGALHVPLDGDVQALVYDISALRGPNTWLVCFEDLDAGSNISPDCCAVDGLTPPGGSGNTDDDYNDLVFEVTATGATPVQLVTFGGIKRLYR